MTQNQNNRNDNQQANLYESTSYNQDFNAQNGNYYGQNDYPSQSYGMSNRYDDLYDYEEEAGSKGFLLGAIIGGIIGAATALFLAPKSGKDFRSDLNTHASTLKEKTSGYTDAIKEKTSGGSDSSGGGLTQQVKDQTSKVVDKVKNLKGGQSPMDDGTASSEGEESIEMLDTVTVHSTVDDTDTESFTSTAAALREAVEEVKEDKNTGSATSGTTGSSTGGSTSGSTGSTGTGSSSSSNNASSSSNSNKSSNSSSSTNSNKSSNNSSSNSSNNSNNRKGNSTK